MSSSDDSETAEWEREQMLRGTQSRGQKTNTTKTEKSDATVDATVAKKHVTQDIEKAESTIESIRRSIGSTRLEMIKSEKRIDALKKQIDKLESSHALFEQLANLDELEDIMDFLTKHRLFIDSLPSDQKEMIESLEKRAKNLQSSMDVDNQ